MMRMGIPQLASQKLASRLAFRRRALAGDTILVEIVKAGSLALPSIPIEIPGANPIFLSSVDLP